MASDPSRRRKDARVCSAATAAATATLAPGPLPPSRESFSLAPRSRFQLKMKILCGSALISVLSFNGHNKRRIFKIFLRKIIQKILISGKTRSGIGVSCLHVLWVLKAYKSQEYSTRYLFSFGRYDDCAVLGRTPCIIQIHTIF